MVVLMYWRLTIRATALVLASASAVRGAARITNGGTRYACGKEKEVWKNLKEHSVEVGGTRLSSAPR